MQRVGPEFEDSNSVRDKRDRVWGLIDPDVRTRIKYKIVLVRLTTPSFLRSPFKRSHFYLFIRSSHNTDGPSRYQCRFWSHIETFISLRSSLQVPDSTACRLSSTLTWPQYLKRWTFTESSKDYQLSKIVSTLPLNPRPTMSTHIFV